MSYKIIKQWTTAAGFKAVVVESSVLISPHLCGYVGVPIEHRFHGKRYDDSSGLSISEFEGIPIGKRGVLDLLCMAISGENKSAEIGILFDVHGGITFAGAGAKGYPLEEKNDLWWFGFDCAHAGDTRERCDEPYCVAECESLARQLKQIDRLVVPQTSNQQTGERR